MRVLVYGGGAVGLGIASCLIKSGNDVSILARDDTARDLNLKGLKRTGIFGEYDAPPGGFKAYSRLAEEDSGPFDYVLVCTKAHDSYGAAADLAGYSPVVDGNSFIVLFQNGWGSAEIFSSLFTRERVLCARVITGFTRPERNKVKVTVHADAIRVGNIWGAVPEKLKNLCDAISAGDIPCAISEDVGRDLWAKMLYNCALNALGAIFRVNYGSLGEHEGSRKIMEAVVSEVFQVMEASGFVTHWNRKEEYLEVFYKELLPPTASHESSMLQDIAAGKKTEIEFLNGAIVRLGISAGIPTPVNDTLTLMVRFLS